MAYIEFKNVNKVYKMGEVEIKALSNTSFEIEKGELVVIVGPSGAGKTTTLNILGGMDKATSGEVIVDGKEITKLNDNYLSIFILSIFCGILMYFAVNGFKKLNDFSRFIIVYLGVVVFILCGFEHCIANMYYFSVADVWSLNTLGYVGIMILGNSIGAFILPLFNLYIKD